MGEMLIDNMRGEIPVVIIRPSVIESTYKEPFPGWMEGNRYIYMRVCIRTCIYLLQIYIGILLTDSVDVLALRYYWSSLITLTNAMLTLTSFLSLSLSL